MKAKIIFVIIGILILAGLYSMRTTTSPSTITAPTLSPNLQTTAQPPVKNYPDQSTTKYSATTKTTSKGELVFAITDKSADIGSINSILLTIGSVKVHSPKNGWISITETPQEFDLLKLKATGHDELLADINLAPDTFDQIRLTIGKIYATGKDGSTLEVKLPSNEIKIDGVLLSEKAKTSTILLDFLSDRSLHTTGSGKLIFAPVITVETRSEAIAQILPVTGSNHKKVDIIGGDTKFNGTLGMDENGTVKINNFIDPSSTLEIIGNVIRVIPKDENQTEIKFQSNSVIDKVIKEGLLDNVLSIKTVKRNNQTVWRVVGTKNLEISIIYLDILQGEVVATE
ncbi:MAG: DUF4382 domain-containing protein [Candidatus Vogelbacteria bacterium]|nr:DUF4382 domain-containing protein [Candidatus Vogelbacteria bacterium]